MSRAKQADRDRPIDLPSVRTDAFEAPGLAALRDRPPISRLRYPDGELGWLVTTRALASAVLVDARFGVVRFKAAPASGEYPDLPAEREEGMRAGAMLSQDPPEHTRLRRMQMGFLTVSRVSSRRSIVERIVADRIDALESLGSPADLVTDFAFPVHSATLCELLGFPMSDLAILEHRPQVLRDREVTGLEARVARREWADYVRDAVRQKRTDPGEDMLSELAATTDLSDDELVGLGSLLSGTATANMIAMSIFALLHERQLSNPQAATSEGIEELLRYVSVFQQGINRKALEDVELNGVTIAAGERVTVSLPAVNRDADRYADPDRLDLSRDARGHMAFGSGRHICLGQHLARLELQVSLTALRQRLPGLRLAVSSDEVPFYNGEHAVYGLHSLPVEW
ncbi:cytochrome P450 [Kribbella sp. NPDC050820]|uniref:cytochrome P450 n=1 Tax=Kribbella sp. NPDC050820 TaxID=3155408 RepID=UPI0033D4601F